MKINNDYLKYTIAITLIFNALIINAQLNIQYYAVDNIDFPNSSVNNIGETSSGNILLLCEDSDIKYQNQVVKIVKTDTKGKLTKGETKVVENLTSLVKLVSLNEKSWNIYGNTNYNGIINSVTIPFDSTVVCGPDKTEKNSLSTKLSDVYVNHDGTILLVYTKISKSGLHNIELKQTTKDGEVKWLKAISSENNEEASMMLVNDKNEIYILGKKYNDDLSSYVPIMYKVDAKGNNIWKKGIESTGEFYDHFFCLNNKGNIIYASSYTKSQTGTSETIIMELSDKGIQKNQAILANFTANGISCLDQNKCILYGSEFLINEKQVVTKGKFIIVDEELSAVLTRALTNKDKPDSDLDKKVMTSSDLICMKVLNNGDIALGGKVYMPINEVPNSRSNHALLIIIPNSY